MIKLRAYQGADTTNETHLRPLQLPADVHRAAAAILAEIQKAPVAQVELAKRHTQFLGAWQALQKAELIQPYPRGWVARRGAVRQIYDAFHGHSTETGAPAQRVLLCAPTGTGKTEMAMRVAFDALRQGWRIVFCVNRRTLVTQTAARFRKADFDVGFLWAEGGREYPCRPDAPVQIWSIQTCQQPTRAPVIQRFVGHPKTLIIVDEAHKGAWTTPIKGWLQSPGESRFLGLTATPYRLSREEGMGDLFDAIAATLGYQRLMDDPEPDVMEAYRAAGFPVAHMGAIVRPLYLNLAPTGRVNLTGVGRVGADFNQGQLAKVSNQVPVIRAMLEKWRTWAWGRRTIAFCVDKAHTHATAEVFSGEGVKTGVVTGTASETYTLEGGERVIRDRDEIFAMLDRGELTLLASCEALTEGFDCPPVEVCLLMRATESLALFVQMVGRVLRPCARTGKGLNGWKRRDGLMAGALVLDQTGTVERLGPVELIREFKLERGEKGAKQSAGKKMPQGKECPGCRAVVAVTVSECPMCGYRWPAPRVSGEVKFSAREIAVPKSRAAHEQETRRKMFQFLARAGFYGSPTIPAFKRGKVMPGAVLNAYHRKYGEWPPDEFWRLAPFGGVDSPTNRKEWQQHLERCALKREPEKRARETDPDWVRRYFYLVFPP